MAAKGQASISWPVDEDGKPMAIVSAFSSEHVGSGMGIPEYCGLDIGPVGALVPCKNDPETIQAMEEEMLRRAQHVVGSNRRVIQWMIDPTLKPLTHEEIEQAPAETPVEDAPGGEPPPTSEGAR